MNIKIAAVTLYEIKVQSNKYIDSFTNSRGPVLVYTQRTNR